MKNLCTFLPILIILIYFTGLITVYILVLKIYINKLRKELKNQLSKKFVLSNIILYTPWFDVTRRRAEFSSPIAEEDKETFGIIRDEAHRCLFFCFILGTLVAFLMIIPQNERICR